MKVIYYTPVDTKSKGTRFSQGFGATGACVNPTTRQVIGKYIGIFGEWCKEGFVDLYRDFLNMLGHNGRDWSARIGTPVFFPLEALVISYDDQEFEVTPIEWFARYDDDNDGGIGIDIVSRVPVLECNEGCPLGTKHYIKHRSWHLSGKTVLEGGKVNLGGLIAYTGNSGLSSGPHIHEAIKWCDKEGKGIHSDNGWYGCINHRKHPDIEVRNVFVGDAVSGKKTQQTFLEKVLGLIAELIRSNIKKVGTSLGGIIK